MEVGTITWDSAGRSGSRKDRGAVSGPVRDSDGCRAGRYYAGLGNRGAGGGSG